VAVKEVPVKSKADVAKDIVRETTNAIMRNEYAFAEENGINS
jgi:hypothetical protein